MSSYLQKPMQKFFGIIIMLMVALLCDVSTLLEIEQIVTLGLIPIIAFSGFIIYHPKYERINKSLFIYILIFISSLLSFSAATHVAAAINEIQLIFGALLSAYIAIIYIKGGISEDYFLMGFIFAALIHVVDITFLRDFVITGSSLERNTLALNANKYSYYIYFANISLMYLYLKYKTKSLLVFTALFAVIGTYVPFITVSRSGVVIGIFINTVFWFWVYKPEKKSYFYYLKYIIPFVLFGSAVLYIYNDLYIGSFLALRVDAALQDPGGLRFKLIVDSLNVFLAHPILGLGPGQYLFVSKYGLFSHTSYTEALANQGIIGGVLLFYLFLQPIFYLKHYKNESQLFKFIWLVIVSFLIMNLIYPFYKYPFSVTFFFVVIGILNKYKNTNNRQAPA